MTSPAEADGDVFLIIAPAGRDAPVVAELLASARLACALDPDGQRLLAAMAEGGAAGAIITDDAWARIGDQRLAEAIGRQPPWSDFPFILLSRRNEARPGSGQAGDLANVTVLERPLHPATLISAARAALRSRQRQRRAAEHLAELEQTRVQLHQAAATLEAKVEERTCDLAQANDRLTTEIAERERTEARLIQAQKMEAVGQLTGGLAHDFNNLLTAVVGSLDLLLKRTDDPRVQRLAGNALQAAERGGQLTAQLLAFSRRQRLSPTAVDTNRVITGMGDLLARTISPQVRVETRLDPNLWPALADPTQIEVMILNLAINARDAMPNGGRLTIATANLPRVPTELANDLKPGEYVALSVSDTGSGMSADVLARAFEPFFTTKEPGRGTGLGLSQLYGFAQQSGGTARIDSADGKGTTVTIYLPRAEVEPLRTKERQGTAPQRAHRRSVLLVDDDDAVREVCAGMLEELGCEVEMVGGGEEAIRRLRKREFDLMLTDVAMPGVTGVDLAERAAALRPDMPVLFASGYADLDTFGEGLKGHAVLKKPYRLAELEERLHAIAPRRGGENVVELLR